MTVRVLVTGATGFIGRHLIDRMSGEDVEIVVTSRRPPEHDDPRVVTVRADIGHAGWARDVIEAAAPQRIVHLAGLALGRNDPALLMPMFEANTAASVALLDAALHADVDRVVMAGTLEEHYEGDPEEPTSPYSASKSAATLFSRLVAGYGLDVINARIFMTYGPGQDSAKLIPAIVATQLAGGVAQLRAPQRRYDWIHVADVADALTLLALRDDSPARGYSAIDIGSGTMTPIAEIAEIAGAHLEREDPWIAHPDPDRDVRLERCASPDAMERLGWRPSVELRTGLCDYVDLVVEQVRNRSS